MYKMIMIDDEIEARNRISNILDFEDLGFEKTHKIKSVINNRMVFMACPFRSMLPSGSVSGVYFGGMTLNGTKRGKIFAAGAGEGTLWYSFKDRQE